MIISNINNHIKYDEKRNLDKNDIGNESQIYEYLIYEILIIITLGKINKEYAADGLYFYPIYLVHNNKFVSKIGILEIDINSEKKIYDDDGDIDLEKCREPLFFSFINKEYLKTYNNRENNPEIGRIDEMNDELNDEMNDEMNDETERRDERRDERRKMVKCIYGNK